jgi:hypothetical protein
MPLDSLLPSSGDPDCFLLLVISGDEAALELSDELVGLALG